MSDILTSDNSKTLTMDNFYIKRLLLEVDSLVLSYNDQPCLCELRSQLREPNHNSIGEE